MPVQADDVFAPNGTMSSVEYEVSNLACMQFYARTALSVSSAYLSAVKAGTAKAREANELRALVRDGLHAAWAAARFAPEKPTAQVQARADAIAKRASANVNGPEATGCRTITKAAEDMLFQKLSPNDRLGFEKKVDESLARVLAGGPP